VTAFNDILEAVAITQGSEVARALVDRFATHTPTESESKRESNDEVDGNGENTADEQRNVANDLPPSMPRFLRDAIKADKLPRASILIPSGKESYQPVAMYGRFQKLGPTTVRIIVRQAVRERRELKSTASFSSASSDQPTTASLEIFSWALYALRRAGHGQSVVWDEMVESKVLTSEEMSRIKGRAGEMRRE
jgi:hypothetical protein